MPNELPLNWCECKLEDLCEVISKGSTPKNQTEKPNWAKILKAENITKESIIDSTSCKYIDKETHTTTLKRSILKKNDILITIAGTLGRCAVVETEENLNTNQAVCFVRLLNCGISPHFIKYYALSPVVNNGLTGKAKITAIPNLTLEVIKNIDVVLPPLAEQKRIVEKIEALFADIDEGVENLKTAQAQIKQYRQSVLKSAFEGKLYKTTEWKETNLGNVCEKVFKRKETKDENEKFKYIDISSINNKTLRIETPVLTNGKEAPSRARQIVKTGDVVFSTVRTYLMNIGYVSKELDNQIASTGFCVIRGVKNILNGKFIFYKSISQEFLKPLNQMQYGAVYPAVRDKDVFAQNILLPTFSEQQRIVEEIEKRFAVADELEKAVKDGLEKADKLKQSILKKAFEGKLVAQDPNDEPASVLLDRIKKETQSQTKGRKK